MANLPKSAQQDGIINTPQDDAYDSATQLQKQAVSAGYGKEHGRFTVEDMSEKKEYEVEEVGNVEIEPEVESAGVTVTKEHIEIPPDLKKLGVQQVGASVQVAQDDTVQNLKLPISDEQVVTGLHAQVMSSLRWLAEWCVKKLKAAHLVLKEVHGKIVRVKS